MSEGPSSQTCLLALEEHHKHLFETMQQAATVIETTLRTVRETLMQTTDHSLRYAYMLECKRYSEILARIRELNHDDAQISTEAIDYLEMELEKEIERNSHSILTVISQAHQLLDLSPPQMVMAQQKIHLATTLFRICKSSMPTDQINVLYAHINLCIIRRNKLCQKKELSKNHTNRILLHLSDARIKYEKVLEFDVKCGHCGDVEHVTGFSDGDIYGPVTCKKCNSCHLITGAMGTMGGARVSQTGSTTNDKACCKIM